MNKNLKMIVLENQNALLQMENEKLKADLDYVAMMTDVDIPTEEDVANEIS